MLHKKSQMSQLCALVIAQRTAIALSIDFEHMCFHDGPINVGINPHSFGIGKYPSINTEKDSVHRPEQITPMRLAGCFAQIKKQTTNSALSGHISSQTMLLTVIQSHTAVFIILSNRSALCTCRVAAIFSKRFKIKITFCGLSMLCPIAKM